MFWIIYITSFALVAYLCLAVFYKSNVSENYKTKFRKLMLVISHPDDEVMFFAPSLLGFMGLFGKDNVYVLCITSGNFYGDGTQREKELTESCKHLGLLPPNILLLQQSEFFDDPNIEWDESALSIKISEVCMKKNIDVVLSFSANGVSGHRNHIQTYKAVMKLQHLARLFLCDLNIVRKYSSIIDVCTTILLDQCFSEEHFIFVSSPVDVLKTYSAMCCHASQLVWFRKLYFLFSRYVLINHLKLSEPLQDR